MHLCSETPPHRRWMFHLVHRQYVLRSAVGRRELPQGGEARFLSGASVASASLSGRVPVTTGKHRNRALHVPCKTPSLPPAKRIQQELCVHRPVARWATQASGTMGASSCLTPKRVCSSRRPSTESMGSVPPAPVSQLLRREALPSPIASARCVPLVSQRDGVQFSRIACLNPA